MAQRARTERPSAGAASVPAKHQHLLQQVGVPPFVVGLLSREMPDWTDDQWHGLAIDRRQQRSTRRHLELPASFDAALQVIAAERLIEAGRTGQARMLAGFAVEELPGNESLMAWESALVTEHTSELDLHALVLGLEPGTTPQEEPPQEGGEPSAPA